MKSFLISDNRDSLIGMRMAGIDGVIVDATDPVETWKITEEKLKSPEVGILFLTEKAADAIREKLLEFRVKSIFPLITVIPDRHGFTSHNEITKYISEAIGM